MKIISVGFKYTSSKRLCLNYLSVDCVHLRWTKQTDDGFFFITISVIFFFLQAVDTGDSIIFTSTDQCRMEKLVLNFEDIGWEDWVIYPKGFETNYCAGSCLFPLGKEAKPTNHATVLSLARSFGRLWDIPQPSCVPDTLAPLTLLFMDRSNHVLLKNYPDMKVVTCSCKWWPLLRHICSSGLFFFAVLKDTVGHYYRVMLNKTKNSAI